MDTLDMKAALGQIALAIGMKSLERLTSQLDPDVMLQQATELIRTELKETFQGILGDEENPWAANLIDRLYQDLDASEVIDKIASPLATAMIDYFKQETSDLIAAIIAEIDLDVISELVAEKIAAKIQIGS
jgi:hypothetical protein